MKQGNLNIRCTEDYAVLYWDKPAAAPSGAEYTVSLNGEAIGRTDRTHFTIEGLSYGSAFRVDVVSGSYCIGSATLQFGREKRRIDITAAPYFCKGDGHILNTDNLQRAINDCGADDILYVPAGDFLTGALRLHSDLEIYLAKGAVLQGTTNIHDYSPRIPSRFEGTEMRCYSSLLNAGDMNHKTGPNCRNIIIRGRGTICGGGQELARKIIEDERARIKSFLDDNRELVESCENSDTIPGRVRPRLINLSNCENVWISGITLKNGPSWNVHMIYCDDIQTDTAPLCPRASGTATAGTRIPRRTARCLRRSSPRGTTLSPSRAAKTPRATKSTVPARISGCLTAAATAATASASAAR